MLPQTPKSQVEPAHHIELQNAAESPRILCPCKGYFKEMRLCKNLHIAELNAYGVR